MSKNLKNGQQMGLRILIAKDLGFDAGYVTEAEKLFQEKPVLPALLGRLEEESIRGVEWINANNKTPEAYAKIDEFKTKYNVG